VAELASAALVAPVQLTSEYQTGADAGAHSHVDEVASPPPGAAPMFGQGGQVGVVLDQALTPEQLLELLSEWDPTPAW
jgi:hypothetical protein